MLFFSGCKTCLRCSVVVRGYVDMQPMCVLVFQSDGVCLVRDHILNPVIQDLRYVGAVFLLSPFVAPIQCAFELFQSSYPLVSCIYVFQVKSPEIVSMAKLSKQITFEETTLWPFEISRHHIGFSYKSQGSQGSPRK